MPLLRRRSHTLASSMQNGGQHRTARAFLQHGVSDARMQGIKRLWWVFNVN